MKVQVSVGEEEEWLKTHVDPRADELGLTRNAFYAVVMRQWVILADKGALLGGQPLKNAPRSAATIPRDAPGAAVAPKRGPGRPPKVRVIDPELLKPVTYHITDPFLQKAGADPTVLKKLGFLPEHLGANGLPKNWTIDREFDDATLNAGSSGGFVPPEVDFEQPED